MLRKDRDEAEPVGQRGPARTVVEGVGRLAATMQSDHQCRMTRQVIGNVHQHAQVAWVDAVRRALAQPVRAMALRLRTWPATLGFLQVLELAPQFVEIRKGIPDASHEPPCCDAQFSSVHRNMVASEAGTRALSERLAVRANCDVERALDQSTPLASAPTSVPERNAIEPNCPAPAPGEAVPAWAPVETEVAIRLLVAIFVLSFGRR